MKAILNKRFDLFMTAVNYLWSRRKEVIKDAQDNDSFTCKVLGEYPKIEQFSDDIFMLLEEVYFGMEEFKTKKQLIDWALSSINYNFYVEFVKKIE